MTSKAQKRQGYPLPEIVYPEDTLSFCVTIPNDPAYYNALYAQLTDLGHWWKWKRSEDRPEDATLSAMTWREKFVMTENCGGGDVATKDDIRDGIYEAANRIALQIASGQYANLSFSTDDDGIVTPTPDDDDENNPDLPEDDPDTAYDETQAAIYGGRFAQDKAFESYLDKIDAYYGNTNGSPATVQAAAEILIAAYFSVDIPALTAAMTSYYAYRGSNPVMNFNSSDAIRQFVYCRGGGARAYNQWLIDSSGFSVGKINMMTQLVFALAPDFWSSYYDTGISKPSTAYRDAPCVPIADQTIPVLLFGVAQQTTPLKASHRMLIRASGYAQDVDGDIQDFFWYHSAAGINTRSNPTFTHSAGSNLPTDNQVVYNPTTHEYEYTIDLGALNALMTITMNKNANMNAAGLTYPVPFSITLIDLGEYTV